MTNLFNSGPVDFSQFFDDSEPMSDEEWERELDAAFEQAVSGFRIEKGSGYCDNMDCEKYAKGSFLFYYEGEFVCPACGVQGLTVPEKGIPVRNPGETFAEVRVEYSYDPSQRKFREIAILRDEAWLGDYGIYTFQSPLIATEKRALKTAEILLCTLNEKVFSDEDLINPPRTQERLLSFDKPLAEFRQELSQLEQRLQDNSFLNELVVPKLREEESSMKEGESGGPQS